MKKVLPILLAIILTLSGVVGLLAAYPPPAAQAAQLYKTWAFTNKNLGMLTNTQILTFAGPDPVPVADLVRIDIYVKLVSQTSMFNIDVNIGLANSAGPFPPPVPTDKVFNQAGTGLLRSREPIGKEVNYTVTAADMTAMKNAGTDLAYICYGEVGGAAALRGATLI